MEQIRTMYEMINGALINFFVNTLGSVELYTLTILMIIFVIMPTIVYLFAILIGKQTIKEAKIGILSFFFLGLIVWGLILYADTNNQNTANNIIPNTNSQQQTNESITETQPVEEKEIPSIPEPKEENQATEEVELVNLISAKKEMDTLIDTTFLNSFIHVSLQEQQKKAEKVKEDIEHFWTIVEKYGNIYKEEDIFGEANQTMINIICYQKQNEGNTYIYAQPIKECGDFFKYLELRGYKISISDTYYELSLENWAKIFADKLNGDLIEK